MFGLVWTNYCDDYPQLDIVSSSSNAQDTAEKFLAVLGWKFSIARDKDRQGMSKSFSALGVTFDFSSSKVKKKKNSCPQQARSC